MDGGSRARQNERRHVTTCEESGPMEAKDVSVWTPSEMVLARRRVASELVGPQKISKHVL